MTDIVNMLQTHLDLALFFMFLFFTIIGFAATLLYLMDTFTKWHGLGSGFHDRLTKVFVNLDACAKNKKSFISKYPYGLIAILFLVVILFVGIVPMFAEYFYSDLGTEKGQIHPFNVVNESRKTIAQIIGGIVAIIAFYFMWERNRLTAQGQITERFTQAVEQLGHDKIAVRLGGIYALERIARDSKEDHWSVMEVLTAYVRGNCPVNKEKKTKASEWLGGKSMIDYLKDHRPDGDQGERVLNKDIQAILDVIGRRGHIETEGDRRLNLANVDLRGADMNKKGEQEVNFSNAIFTGSDLRGVKLSMAKLQGADLSDANLQGADLYKAKLQGADLNEANLQEASLWWANLQWAEMSYSNLQGAVMFYSNLQGAEMIYANLQWAKLSNANLQGANLSWANLQGAKLSRANLQGADLSDANLQGADLSYANLQGANLFMAKLQGADLSDANLQGANLNEAKLQGAELFSANLQVADLREAKLQGASLRNAKLQGANISLSSIYGADFSGANMADILCFNSDTTTKDDTEWDRIIAECEGESLKDDLKKVKTDIIKSQTSPWKQPAALVSNKEGFIAAIKNIDFENSFVTQGILNQAVWPLSEEEKAAYSERAAYIRANCPENIRQEIIARGWGDLLEDPASSPG